jgi:hypothetical protein
MWDTGAQATSIQHVIPAAPTLPMPHQHCGIYIIVFVRKGCGYRTDADIDQILQRFARTRGRP